MIQKSPKQVSNRSSLFTVLDVGTSKIVCFIARPLANGKAEVVGIGHQVSNGIRNGNIVDMAAVETSIRSTVESAEEMAGENVRDLSLCISGLVPESKLVSFDVAISSNQIGDTDLKRAIDPTWLHSQQNDDRLIIHALPINYSIDGNSGIKDPRGMHCGKLGVNMHVITTSIRAVKNITACVNRCHLDVDSQILGSYAAGLACLVEDEKELGVVCLDIGGGTTDIAVFYDGELVYTDAIPLGGTHVTNDIARGLSTTLSFAERMKTLYGSVIPSPSDDQEVIKVPLVGEKDDGENQISRSILVGIIRPRMEEIYELVRTKLDQSGFGGDEARRVVLTGGGSQLVGSEELAAEILNKKIRLGTPDFITGLPESVSGPGFSASVGLIRFMINQKNNKLLEISSNTEDLEGFSGFIKKWFRDNV